MKPFDVIYQRVPPHQKEKLRTFRLTHPSRATTVDGAEWEYISCGTGEETVVLLPGGIRSGEIWFNLITALENEYRIISPTYPAVPTMAHLMRGIADIMEKECIEQGHILGTSFGGWIAQCFVRRYPQKAKTLILSHTSGSHWVSLHLLRIGRVATAVYPLRLFRVALRKNYFRLLSIPDSEREFWKAFIEELSLNTTKEDIISQQDCTRDLIRNYVFSRNDLVNWPGRILILESDNDPAFTRDVREELKALYPTAQAHTFHEAGHTPGYTNPGEYVSVIKDFWAKE